MNVKGDFLLEWLAKVAVCSLINARQSCGRGVITTARGAINQGTTARSLISI